MEVRQICSLCGDLRQFIKNCHLEIRKNPFTGREMVDLKELEVAIARAIIEGLPRTTMKFIRYLPDKHLPLTKRIAMFLR